MSAINVYNIKNYPNHEVIVCLYVDDMLIISKNIIDINATKRMLSKSFDMKDLGVADFILGIKNLQNSSRSSVITSLTILTKYLTNSSI